VHFRFVRDYALVNQKYMSNHNIIGYSILAIIALYLAYVISTNIIWLLWLLIKLIVYSILLVGILWFLYKNGFFKFLQKK